MTMLVATRNPQNWKPEVPQNKLGVTNPNPQAGDNDALIFGIYIQSYTPLDFSGLIV